MATWYKAVASAPHLESAAQPCYNAAVIDEFLGKSPHLEGCTSSPKQKEVRHGGRIPDQEAE